MRDWLYRSALERRHDGPIPPVAAIPCDHAAPWRDQLANRRRWAWRDVRRIGHRLVRASRALRARGAAPEHREWRRLRQELAFALQTWKCYRDWTRQPAPPGLTAPRRSARPRPGP